VLVVALLAAASAEVLRRVAVPTLPSVPTLLAHSARGHGRSLRAERRGQCGGDRGRRVVAEWDALALVGAQGLDGTLVVRLRTPALSLVRELTSPGARASLPQSAWTRDPEALLVATTQALYRVTLTDGASRQLPRCCEDGLGTIVNFAPRVSPDDTRVVFGRVGAAALDVRAVADGALLARLPQPAAAAARAISGGEWRADGARLLYLRATPGDTAIVTSGPSGQDERVVSRGYAYYPTWLVPRSGP
jgi:hypothetical protein